MGGPIRLYLYLYKYKKQYICPWVTTVETIDINLVRTVCANIMFNVL